MPVARNPQIRWGSTELQRLPRRSHKVAQHGHIGPVRTNAPSIHGQAELLGLVQIDACVVQFGQAETLRGQHPIQTGRIDRAWWPMPLPGPSCQLIELLPIAFVPSSHSCLAAEFLHRFLATGRLASLHPLFLALFLTTLNDAALDAVRGGKGGILYPIQHGEIL